MRRILKFIVKVSDEPTLLPPNAFGPVVLVGHQPNRMYSDEIGVWIDTKATDEDLKLPTGHRRKFVVKGTGHPLGEGSDRRVEDRHVGSVIIDPYVWHVFEVIN